MADRRAAGWCCEQPPAWDGSAERVGLLGVVAITLTTKKQILATIDIALKHRLLDLDSRLRESERSREWWKRRVQTLDQRCRTQDAEIRRLKERLFRSVEAKTTILLAAQRDLMARNCTLETSILDHSTVHSQPAITSPASQSPPKKRPKIQPSPPRKRHRKTQTVACETTAALSALITTLWNIELIHPDIHLRRLLLATGDVTIPPNPYVSKEQRKELLVKKVEEQIENVRYLRMQNEFLGELVGSRED
ncbi:hypothetical protein NEOLI_003621 [Neolecta irregularis DAH-3]|uniref:Uncharacterized protein n=1 Tax=Neolecta irregularis (strain DAH-3) TaxID=1198029 RepID=A0A1U7LH72_NEOID|nr:hypothetical protein NEOLI_003621 [Neolecta irregularis DAH-3]|eukprot:OLL22005.1 hypothetical protein NEOLI_003621 [Neolecta irregularis DAH-3]